MSGARWIAFGALLMGAAVVLGAFGAHALNDRLVEAGQLENWRTAVRYLVWHALGLIALGLMSTSLVSRVPSAVGWLFLVGSLLFSGSIFGLALDGPGAVLGPITPLGGTLLIIGWGMLAWSAWRASARSDAA